MVCIGSRSGRQIDGYQYRFTSELCAICILDIIYHPSWLRVTGQRLVIRGIKICLVEREFLISLRCRLVVRKAET